jgi:SAM-dependent methyltransferase
MGWIALASGLILLGLLLYWQLVIAEGAYLGPRVVTLLYDLSARAYERIKQFDVGAEQWFLGLPLARALELIPAPLVLDVATGTGRLPRALLRHTAFDGRIIGLDLSRRMLREAVRRTAQFADRLTFVWQDARNLPFDDGTFDAVTCLEALEFTPDPRAVLAELVRVLRPGGVLLVSNRVGRDARFLPGHIFPRDEFERLLRAFPLEDIKVRSGGQGWVSPRWGHPATAGDHALPGLHRPSGPRDAGIPLRYLRPCLPGCGGWGDRDERG